MDNKDKREDEEKHENVARQRGDEGEDEPSEPAGSESSQPLWSHPREKVSPGKISIDNVLKEE